MRLESYLLTEGRMRETDDIEVIQRLFGDHSDAWKQWKKNEGYIFRGVFSTNQGFAIGKGKGSRRRMSANTTNYSTLFFDNHPMWKGYPKRSESFVCSTSKSKAGMYGNIYHAFPKNGTVIGVAPERDMFESFLESGIAMPTMNNLVVKSIELAVEFLGLPEATYPETDYRKMKALSAKIKGLYDKASPETQHDYSRNVKSSIWGFRETRYDGDFLRMMEGNYSPTKNKFRTVVSGQPIPDNREVWFSGECVFVNQVVMHTLLEDIANSGYK